MQDKWRKVDHSIERAETSTGLGEEGGACNKVEEGGALYGES